MPVLLEVNGLFPGRGPDGRAPGVAAGRGAGAPGRGPEAAAGRGAAGAAGAAGVSAAGGAENSAAGATGRGAGAPGRGPEAGRGAAAGAAGAAGAAASATTGRGPGAGGRGPAEGRGAPGRGAGDGAEPTGLGGAGLLADAGFAGLVDPPKATSNFRTTGASIVEDAERTNSPSSWSLAMTTLLSTPKSLASSYTRTLATSLL
jgi:hypothetical protein